MKGKSDKRRICIFSKHLQWLDYGAMAETAAEIGFDGVDLTVRPAGHVLPERVKEDLPMAVEAVRKVGLNVDMITTRITDPREIHTEPILKTANHLGIEYYRMGYFKYNDASSIVQSLDSFKPQLHDLAKLNEQYQIHGAYQNHAGIGVGGPVWDLWYLLRDVDPRWMGCQYDVRHATLEGGYSWPLGLKLLTNHIKTTVIKDFKWVKIEGRWRGQSCPLGKGMVDFKAYFEIIKKNDIDGPISLHFEYPIVGKSERNLGPQERRKKTVSVMRKDLLTLRTLFKEAGL